MHSVGLEVLAANQRFQGVTVEFGIDPPGDKHRAGELLAPLQFDPIQFSVEKAAVKARIMGDQMVLRDEGGKLLHDFSDGWGTLQHLVRDAGILLDETADFHPGIHQALEPVHYFIVLDQNRADFDCPVTIIRREPGGLKVEHDNAVIAHNTAFTFVSS